jgi:hypothetical protein
VHVLLVSGLAALAGTGSAGSAGPTDAEVAANVAAEEVLLSSPKESSRPPAKSQSLLTMLKQKARHIEGESAEPADLDTDLGPGDKESNFQTARGEARLDGLPEDFVLGSLITPRAPKSGEPSPLNYLTTHYDNECLREGVTLYLWVCQCAFCDHRIIWDTKDKSRVRWHFKVNHGIPRALFSTLTEEECKEMVKTGKAPARILAATAKPNATSPETPWGGKGKEQTQCKFMLPTDHPAYKKLVQSYARNICVFGLQAIPEKSPPHLKAFLRDVCTHTNSDWMWEGCDRSSLSADMVAPCCCSWCWCCCCCWCNLVSGFRFVVVSFLL